MQYAFCMQRRAIMYCGKSAVVTSVCRGHVSNSQTIKKDQSLTCNGLVFLGQKWRSGHSVKNVVTSEQKMYEP